MERKKYLVVLRVLGGLALGEGGLAGGGSGVLGGLLGLLGLGLVLLDGGGDVGGLASGGLSAVLVAASGDVLFFLFL